MTEHQTLGSFLAEFGARDEMAAAIARTVKSIADSCCAIAEVIALGPLGGSLGATSGENADGDAQAALDLRANEIVIDELSDAPVAYLASEELDLPLPLNEGAPLYVAIDPLDGSSNIDTNVSVGTIFSVMPMACEDVLGLDEALQKLQKKDSRKAELVKLRFFAGLTTAEAARSLGVSVATAENDWTYARCWLKLEMSGDRPSESAE